MKATIEVIAKKCGVSKATVSYVLNNKKSSLGLSPQTIESHADILKQHFNSLTCTNHMKYLLVHPQENAPLQERILQRQGLVISEQPLGVKASPKTLVRRNRLQAALSQIVVVAQCPVKSGTMYTVEYARTYGKEVLAAQFKYHNEATGGNDYLLEQGIAKGI